MNLFSNVIILIVTLTTIQLSEACPPSTSENNKNQEGSEEKNNIPTWNISFMSLEEFEQKFNIIFSDKEMEAEAAKEFYKQEAEIGKILWKAYTPPSEAIQPKFWVRDLKIARVIH